MQVYDEMVDSGVSWLGSVPVEWGVSRGKYLYANRKEANKGMLEKQRLALTLKGVIERQDGDAIGLNPQSLESYQIFEQGDLVFKLIDLENKRTSRVGLVPKRGIMSPAYIRITPTSQLIAKYFYYYFYSLYITYVFNDIAGEGVRANISGRELLELPVVVPSYEAQQKIADFLDAETAKIDNLIAKQERLLQLLEEKRRATITHAVTRGLNPNVELKETNIPWLGQIPTNYSTMNIKKVFKIVNGSTPKSGISDYWDGDITWVTPSDLSKVSGSIISSSKRTITDSGLASCGASIVPKNSVILSSRAPIGSIAISGTELCTNQGCKALVPSTDVNPTYYYYVLYALVPILNMLGRGTTFLEISSEELSRLKIPVPPIVDQEKIASYLNDQETNVAAMKQKIQTQITLLRERRTSLISHAVTGKIKV